MSWFRKRFVYWLGLSVLFHVIVIAGISRFSERNADAALRTSHAFEPVVIAMQAQVIIDSSREPTPAPIPDSQSLITGAGAVAMAEVVGVVESVVEPEVAEPPQESEPKVIEPLAETLAERELEPKAIAEIFKKVESVAAPEAALVKVMHPENSEEVAPTEAAVVVNSKAPVPIETKQVGMPAIGQDDGRAISVVSGPLPSYPRAARAAGVSGVETILSVRVGTDGRAQAVSLIQSCGRADMDRSAINTVRRKWRFEPATDAAGQAVASVERIAIRWELR